MLTLVLLVGVGYAAFRGGRYVEARTSRYY